MLARLDKVCNDGLRRLMHADRQAGADPLYYGGVRCPPSPLATEPHREAVFEKSVEGHGYFVMTAIASRLTIAMGNGPDVTKGPPPRQPRFFRVRQLKIWAEDVGNGGLCSS